ncbi:hypothetical protein HX99_03870 [Peptococcaceae bacterium SCADC1_2_3]|nr:hypothetical protein HX99_03870 [Peptococcaceae bacterium SCADC1_2_3]
MKAQMVFQEHKGRKCPPRSNTPKDKYKEKQAKPPGDTFIIALPFHPAILKAQLKDQNQQLQI